MWKSKFFRTLIFSFCTVILLYTIGALGVYYAKNDEIAKMERNSTQKLLLQQAQEMMDQRIQVALNGMIQLETSDAFKQYTAGTKPNLKNYYMGLVLKEIQRNKTAFSNYDYDIAMMQHNDNTVITSAYTLPTDYFFKQLDMSKESVRNFEAFARDTSWSSYFRTITVTGPSAADTLTLIKKYRVSSKNTVFFFLSFKKIAFLPESLENGKDALMLVSEENVLPLDKRAQVDLGNLPKEMASRNEQISHYSKFKRKGHIIHSAGSSSLKDLTYVYITPEKPPQTEQNGQWLTMALLPAGLLLAGVLIASVLIWHTYKPVYSMVSAFKENHAMKAGEDEFVFVQKTARNIEKVNRELTTLMEEHQVPLKAKFLWDALHGLADEQTIQKGISLYQLEPYKNLVSVMIVEFGIPMSNQGRSKLREEITALLKDVFGSNGYAEAAELDSSRFAVITTGLSADELKDRTSAALGMLDPAIRRSVTAAIGGEASGLENIDLSFQQAADLLGSRIMFEKKQVLCWEGELLKQKQTFFYPLEVEKELIQFFVQGRREEGFQILDRIVSENVEKRSLDKFALSQFIFAMAGTVNRIVQSASQAPRDEMLHLELSGIKDRETLKEEIVKIFTSASDRIVSSGQGATAAGQIVNYIRAHYHQDLSLQDLSDHFQLTPSYISTIFKEHTGENYKEYLNRYRIQKAKELLAGRKIKVHEASKLVGYNNVNTFIRIFKKYVGLSPGQYEKSEGS
ncbi:helix-turn-helix domain-containing protein [Bacillus mangrovi]|uniref:Helix-turn-helix domain-containing protein n=1 Tax=Metabacillus mangrovi TaxID=1491830 RepID=A0A7X2V5M7_9BACI|nr:helix-turn-helix domain-containing protein [Metabacillus mangrovi]MTH54344.1 helix-turn-helix domain-containing protein [Metabacillus mangrovi]